MKLIPNNSMPVSLLLLIAGSFSVITPLNAATYGQQVVAAVLMAEARGEGERAMVAVAEVIRTRADQLHVSPLAVVQKKWQFSCLNNMSPEQLIRRHWNDSFWSTAIEIARTAYNAPDRLPGVSKGATHFHSFPNFRRVAWTGSSLPVAVIGKLKFYRLDE